MTNKFKFSEIKEIAAWDRRRLRITLNNNRVILCERIDFFNQEGSYEECGFFTHRAYDEYYNPTLNEFAK